MNLCMVTTDGELLTPGLGTILEGVTRDCVLALAAEHGPDPGRAQDRAGRDLRTRCTDGSISEVFAAGTAAVITPIKGFRGDGYDVTVGTGEPGKQTMAIGITCSTSSTAVPRTVRTGCTESASGRLPVGL